MQFYSHTSYVSLIKASVEERKRADPGFTFQKLAESAGLQKSYLSKVLNGSAHLNSDQLYMIAEVFGWPEENREFTLLLLELERTGLDKRRRTLTKRIDRFRAKKMETSRHIEAASPSLSPEELQEFYLSPWLQILHVAISIPSWGSSLAELGKKFRLDPPTLSRYLGTLVKLNMAEWRGKGILQKTKSLHLSKDSPLYPAWRNQLRMHCLNRLQTAATPDDYSFSVTYSADEATRSWLHQEFLSLIGRLEQRVKKAPVEGVYQMNFDLFPWGK